MAEPGRLMGQTADPNLDDADADGDYDMDDVDEEHTPADDNGPDTSTHTLDAEGSTIDAEGDDVDAEGEEVDDYDDEAEPVGAVKIRASSDDNEDEDAFSDAKTSDSEHTDASSSESEEENQWQAESEDGEEAEVARTDPNVCIYCNQDEEHDPSPEFEEYLACIVCGDNAHRQCARDANTLSPDDDATHWRCTACIQYDLHEDEAGAEKAAEEEDDDDEEDEEEGEEEEGAPSVSASLASLTRRRLSSVPKLARDLLPSHRGGVDPGGHSIFNELILPDEPTDGTRSLRKRKSSHEHELRPPSRQTRKKRRPSEVSKSEAGPSIAASSPRAPARGAAADDDESEDGAQHSGSDEESQVRSTRARRAIPKRNDKRPLVWIEESQGLSLIIVFHLTNEKVQKIVTSKPKKRAPTLTIEQERQERRRERDRERRERNRRAAQAARESPEVTHYPSIQPIHAAPFPGFVDKEANESKSKPYGGILSEADADTSKTYPSQADRKRFEDARVKAEEEWTEKQAALYANLEPAKLNKQATTASKIKCVNFGGWEIDTWHAAPYPEEYSKNRVLYICEFCLKYMNSDYVAWRHKLKCPAKHPPGDEIYRDGKYSFFEVDGRKNPVYCQNLCLLAKLFLGSKTLYYDVEPFLFYVMTENDNYGCHFVGYFSKEKRPSSLNNVSCILVLPIHMRKGYGQYLIEFSYLLTRVERKTGSPEKPLSDMGLVSYRKYWRLVLCEELLEQKGPISIAAISERTGMTADDIVSALEGLRALVRDPVTKKYALRLDLNYFKQYIEKCTAAGNPTVKAECLVWTPYVMGRLGQYEDGPTLHAVQQRDDIEDEDIPAQTPEEGVQIAEAAKANNSTNNSTPALADDTEPTPDIPQEDSINGSPAPATPLANGSTIALAGSQIAPPTDPAIPPTRYEIFPPIPGQPAAKRRPGRPFGARRRTSTPNRARNTNLTMHTAPVPKLRFSPSRAPATPGTVSLRRTRSRLGESVVNLNNDEAEEDGPGKVVKLNGGRRSTRSSTTSMGSPRNRPDGKGKGKAVPIDEEIEEEGDGDVDAEYDDADVDAEGEMDVDAEGDVDGDGDGDIDAEGEDDDDVVMADA
ncbi:hypothetical protein P153DRAFT_422321 [Dothidotthia symphoricarpi CBS 119687]|uniref:Histone acetyltransferase n=1 Tax=Dothidotthia symphoricarpi CBS 119687 TaxID=1392245 RepID=A0A6A6AHM9_9PLEO|nr:uncharacterized protein P153DRAFT_422321 [Dothidotthia symphoricarpi CBS 119687]KAF2130407.1 hypothetical protein P153DRAFT_422321 [Dothidotthia symphoricarpi CBS 119687]